MTTPAVDLLALIEEAISLKKGDHEFVLYRHTATEWSAFIGNPSVHVLMMEAGAHLAGRGETAEAALRSLIETLKGSSTWRAKKGRGS